jgi:RNA polymerase sigma-70 factor (family 1)
LQIIRVYSHPIRNYSCMPTPELYNLFENLFREHYNELSNYAYSILKNREDAEDAVQDVFIKIWQKDPNVINNDGIKFYLLTATRNTCISFLRKQAGQYNITPEHLTNIPADEITTSATIDYNALVKNALALLPPQCLAIFKLSRFARLTYQQIADELGLSVKTVENQMGKALKIMREYAKQNQVSFTLLLFLISQCLYSLPALA